MRILTVAVVAVMFAGCVDEPSRVSSATQETACQEGHCLPGDDGGDWIDPASSIAQPAANAVFGHTGDPVDRCKWKGACVVCYNLLDWPFGHAAYACMVCSDSGLNRCGEYNTVLDDWAIA